MEVYTYTYINRYIDTNLMKISLVVISIIIALQATSFIHGAHERFVYHNTIHQISQLVSPFTKTATKAQSKQPCNCFHYDQQLRYGIIAFMYASSFLLFLGEAVWPALVSQVFWIVFQSFLCTDRSVDNIRNFVVQLLILFVLASNMKCSSCSPQKNSTKTEVQNSSKNNNNIINKQSIITGGSSVNLSKKSSQDNKLSEVPSNKQIEKTASKNQNVKGQTKQVIKTKKTN